jgi:hypothetical protein
MNEIDRLRSRIPNEIVQFILYFIDDPIPCRFVCRLWRDLLLLSVKSDYTTMLVRSGYFGLLKWARTNGAPWGELIYTHAAIKGRLDILDWLQENNCPFDNVTYNCVVRNDCLDVLKWLRMNEIPWNRETCFKIAKQYKCRKILKWLKNQE